MAPTQAQWDAHRQRMDSEYPYEVRVAGGIDVLKSALEAAGCDYQITIEHPSDFESSTSAGPYTLAEFFRLRDELWDGR